MDRYNTVFSLPIEDLLFYKIALCADGFCLFLRNYYICAFSTKSCKENKQQSFKT